MSNTRSSSLAVVLISIALTQVACDGGLGAGASSAIEDRALEIVTEVERHWPTQSFAGDIDRPDRMRVPLRLRPDISPRFVTDLHDRLILASEATAPAPHGTRPQAVFPRAAAEGVRVTATPHEDAWLVMRPATPTRSTRNEVDGLIVYPAMVGGVDTIYTVTDHRLEEFFVLRAAADVASLRFDIELGPGLETLREIDGGLDALNASGQVLLRSPAPVGLDADHRPVSGRLVATHTGGKRWSVHVALNTVNPTYPVLLDPSWVGTGSSLSPYAFGSAALLTTGEVLLTGDPNSATAELYHPDTGTFRRASPMSAARSGHTSTVLLDGRVLIAGGLVPTTVGGGSTLAATATAELYDPTTGTFAATGPMRRARESHTATLLRDGRVLVVTGYDNGYLADVELYDPATGTFSDAAPLPRARYRHTATLLDDGRVLITGGWSFDTFGVSDQDIYDPATGTWTPVEPLIHGRVGHSATRLHDGRVLIAGGLSGPARDGTELFDPTTGHMTMGPSFADARGNHSATLLPSGQVLLAGGSGLSANGVTPIHTSTALYTPGGPLVPGTFAIGLPLPGPRVGHAALMLPTGRLLLALGRSTFTTAETNASLYDPGTPTLTTTGTPQFRRRGGTRTLLPNGEVLLVGGRPASGLPALASTERYLPDFEGFFLSTPLLSGRIGHTATLLPSGQVLIAGGATPTVVELEPGVPTEVLDPVPSAELFTPHPQFSPTRLASVRTTGTLVSPRHGHRATLLHGGHVLLSGGLDRNGTITQLETFDPADGTFSAGPTSSIGSENHTATLLRDGRVLLIAEGATALAELYDPADSPPSLTPTGTPTETRIAGASATLLADGRVLHAGGGGKTRAALYDPATGLFTATGPLNVGRNAHEAALLTSGRVLIVGGGSGAELYDPVTGTFTVIAAAQTLVATTRLAMLPSGALLLTNEAAGPARVFSEGLVPDRAFGPSLSTVEVSQGSFASGLGLTLRGSRFDADFAQAGRTSEASAHRPVVKLTRIDNGQVVIAKTTQTPAPANTTQVLSATLPAGLSKGPYRVTVTAGGQQSLPRVFPMPIGASCTLDVECGAGACVDGACCADCAAYVVLYDGPYTQTFDTLASSGSTGSAMPQGWYFSEVGTAADTTYGVGPGTGTVGNTWSFGSANSTERALGGLQSGSVNPTFGAAIKNGSTQTLSSVIVGYVGEQWRMGAAGREDRLDFQVSLDATSLTTGTWIDIDPLDFIAPSTTGNTGARDGNLAENRRELSLSLPIPGGAALGNVVWIRWNDFNPSGSDDGLAIDEVRLEPVFADPPPGAIARLGFAARAESLPLVPGDVVGIDMTLTVEAASPEALREVQLSVRPVGTLVRPIPGTLVLTVDGVSSPLTIEADGDRGEASISAVARLASLAIGQSATLSVDVQVLPDSDDTLSFSGLGLWVGATHGTVGGTSGQLGGLSVVECRDASHCVAGPACTLGGACESGVCATRTPRACDDGVACTVDACDRATDTCVSTPTNALCDDDEACTTDTCDAVSGCRHTPLTGACDDGNACTTGETCTSGTCAGTPVTCADDGNACTDTTCVPASGCVTTNNTASCDDGDNCTTNDRCAGGTCAGSLRDCNDNDACTIDQCNSGGQCANTPLSCGPGELCEAGVCASTQCDTCDDTTNCGPNSACIDTATGRRCLIACEDNDDCADDQTCALPTDEAADTRRCFAVEGECRAPDAPVEPGPEVVESEPQPEVDEPQPEVIEPGPEPTEPDPEPQPETQPEPQPDTVEPAPDTSPESGATSKDGGGCGSGPIGSGLMSLMVWVLATGVNRRRSVLERGRLR